MFKKLSLVVILALLLSTIYFLGKNYKKSDNLPVTDRKEGNMKIISSAFSEGQKIPQKYSCDGENISPPLSILDVPANSVSLVLIMDDPDAPAGTWVHWLVWNIDPNVKDITEGATPSGSVSGTTSFGDVGYGGPCPPSGQHRYFFKLYALNSKIDLKEDAKVENLTQAMKNHLIQETSLMGVYSR